MKQNKMRILTATLCLLFCMSLVGPLAAKHYGSHAFDESVSWADYDIMGARQVPFDAGYYNIIADVPHNDRGYSVVEVFNEFGVLDGYAIAGSSMNSNGDLDFLLIRTDVAGNEIWRQTYDYGDHSTNVAYDLVQCSDQGFALVGQTIDYSVNYGDCLLLRTYADGTLWWAQPLDNFGRNDVGYSLVELDSGGFAIAAATSDGPGSGGNWDGWLIITDAMGVIDAANSQTFGDLDSELPLAIIAHPDGGFAMAGYVSHATIYSSDMWLLRVYDDGSWWDQTYGDIGFDYGTSLIVTDDGGFAIGGLTYNYGAVGLDAWLVKTDAMGVYQWSETYGGDGNEQSCTIVKSVCGGYALGTATYNFETNSYDFWLLRFSSDWTLLEDQLFAHPGYDYFWSMIQSENHDFAMVGWTSSPLGDSEVLLILASPPSTPQDAIEVIINQIDDLVDSGTLPVGPGNALKAILGAVIGPNDQGDTQSTKSQLNAFINLVDGFVSQGFLSADEGDRLVALAEEVICIFT